MKHISTLIAASALALFACEDGHGSEFVDEPVEIAFEARVADLPFACGQTYTNLGTDAASGTPQDFRIYVYDVRLVTDAGEEHPFDLDDDGLHQGGGVALLDFEDGTGACNNGTAELHTTLKGTVRAQPRHSDGEAGYSEIRFRIGIPGEQNHADLTTLPAPLNDTTLSWSWNAGHIFFSAWGVFGGDAPFPVGVHVGSTGCMGDAMLGEVVACSNANSPEIALAGFDHDSSKIVIDWGAMFAGLSLAAPSAACEEVEGEVSCGCHSFGPEPLCTPFFSQLGLDWSNGKNVAGQSVFRVQ
ncbi:MAG: metallo-mystery pair system four-Cys motif protein [Nannocystis sp.]|uniref:MbnP family copper-binding protein n=1 Tax=Nannocystis sp. TaxID=1962667 RepID=UPI0024226EE2|nr:MbnP family copper-binding protein [Nannocystis sp.]MBK9757513.1 metallo-mystery pair system four-Cys motif protein [Nannocystis sp.]